MYMLIYVVIKKKNAVLCLFLVLLDTPFEGCCSQSPASISKPSPLSLLLTHSWLLLLTNFMSSFGFISLIETRSGLRLGLLLVLVPSSASLYWCIHSVSASMALYPTHPTSVVVSTFLNAKKLDCPNACPWGVPFWVTAPHFSTAPYKMPSEKQKIDEDLV